MRYEHTIGTYVVLEDTLSRSFAKNITASFLFYHEALPSVDRLVLRIVRPSRGAFYESVLLQKRPTEGSEDSTLARNCNTMNPRMGVKSIWPMIGGMRLRNRLRYGSVICLKMDHG